MTAIDILLLLLFGIAVYFIYHYRQLAQQAKGDTQTQRLLVEKLQHENSTRDTLLGDLQQSKTDNAAALQALREQLEDAEEVKSNLEARIVQFENEKSYLLASNASQDITRSNAILSTFAHVTYDMVLVVDTACVIIALNQAAAVFFNGKNPVGQKLCDIVNAPDLQDVVMGAVNEEEGIEEQFVLDKRYFRARAQRYRVSEGQFFIGVALQDVTQLVRLNRARRDMVANISHELGTPVANIRIIIDSLFHDHSRPKRKASIASLRAIARETEALQWTVQELLDLSMIESGQAIMKLVKEPLHEIVDEAIARLDEKLDRKNLHVVRHVPLKLDVLCDRDHVRRVIVNLISNAIKWSPDYETITISAARKDEDIVVSVFDNGPGVPDDQRERIFERFYQVDTSRSGQGSGLGLAISKHIVEAHGGTIWAEGNSLGGGGRFLFTLLNAGATTDEEPYMDRGQHDALLNPYATHANGVAADTPPVQHHDEGEIEFEDDELEN
jgi:signal transduction histidine kinase